MKFAWKIVFCRGRQQKYISHTNTNKKMRNIQKKDTPRSYNIVLIYDNHYLYKHTPLLLRIQFCIQMFSNIDIFISSMRNTELTIIIGWFF